MNLKERIVEFLKGISNSTLMEIYIEYCNVAEVDREVYNNDEYFFEEIYYGRTTYESVRASQYGNYNYTDEFVVVNSYGNLDSYNELSEVIDLDEVADYIMDKLLPM
jgi:hypothetical protein